MCRLRPLKQHISGPLRSNGEWQQVNPLKPREFIPDLGMFSVHSVEVRFEGARGLLTVMVAGKNHWNGRRWHGTAMGSEV
ncbi:hypothetical protein V6N12_046524 [Hibiscus sabdariffa]|uniref:Uncharacterized protein n=1 Tax=Hibiscus sabdariffa TaxID=183260 RepID=A0ABR2DIW1_9ROSI